MDTIAKTIAVPRDHKAIRIPSFPALERTGLLSFTDTRTYLQGADTKFRAAVVRDPAFPLWIQGTPFTTGSPASVFTLMTDNTNAIEIGAVSSTTITPSSNYDWITYAGAVPLATPGVLPKWMKGGNAFMPNYLGYLGVEMAVAGNPGNSAFDLMIDVVTHQNDVVSLSASATATADSTRSKYTIGCTVDIPVALYTAVRLVSVAVQTTNNCVLYTSAWGVCGTGGGSTPLTKPAGTGPGPLITTLYPAFPPPEITSTELPYKNVRANAAACLFSNVGKALNKEGTINAARVPCENLTFMAGSLYAQAINAVYPKDRYFGALENGLYTFTLPDTGSEVFRDVYPGCGPAPVLADFIHTGYLDNKLDIRPVVFDTDLVHYGHLIEFEDLDSANATQLAVTLDRHLEFRSTSALFPLGFSTVPLEAYHISQMALVQMGVFFENPIHMKAIAAMAAKAFASMRPIIMPIMKTAASAGLSKAVSMVNKKMGDMTQAKLQKPHPPVRPKAKPKTKVRTSKR